MKPYRVLIVEDHPFQHEFLRTLFSTLGGFQTEAVWDGATALQRLNAQPYDLVVTDLFMPEMDGVQLIQSIARLDNAPALALMSVASRRMLVSAGLVAKNLSLEVLGLISKPVEACDIQRLRECLDKRRSDLNVARNHPLQPARQCLLAAMQSEKCRRGSNRKNPCVTAASAAPKRWCVGDIRSRARCCPRIFCRRYNASGWRKHCCG